MHLHNIGRIRRYLTPEATKSPVHAFIMSRLDYGNALLAGLPLAHLKSSSEYKTSLHARIMILKSPSHHAVTISHQFTSNWSWLPIKRRIELKILLHVFRCINGTALLYLAGRLKRQAAHVRRSNTCWKCRGQRSCVSFGDRSFKVVGPRLWNALPIAIKCIGHLFIT